MIEGEPLYQRQSSSKTLYLIVNGSPTISNPENVSALFRDYLSMTLKVDAEKRPDASTLLQVCSFSLRSCAYGADRAAIAPILQGRRIAPHVEALYHGSTRSSQVEITTAGAYTPPTNINVPRVLNLTILSSNSAASPFPLSFTPVAH